MTTIDPQNVLFDDSAILKKLFGQHELTAPSANANCDCIGYSAPDDEDTDSHQIAPIADQAA